MIYVTKNNVLVYSAEYLTEEEKVTAWETEMPEQLPTKEGYTSHLTIDYENKILAYHYVEKTPSPEDEIATLKQQLADTEKKMDEAIVELTLAMTMGGMPNV